VDSDLDLDLRPMDMDLDLTHPDLNLIFKVFYNYDLA